MSKGDHLIAAAIVLVTVALLASSCAQVRDAAAELDRIICTPTPATPKLTEQPEPPDRQL